MQGEPRATHDIDIVVEVLPGKIEAFLGEFSPNDYYYDIDSAKAAIKTGDMFNILSLTSGDRVDIWPLGTSAFDQSRFLRRQTVVLFDRAVKVSSSEDTILMKLLWAKMSGGSDKQLYDAARVYELQLDVLDESYIALWIEKLGLEKQCANMGRFLDSNP
ncbi:MAG: hypothetical protein LBC35_00750 [Coriobacteriales bacterium]|jgi:hypothetical protein|nr:hypothetical protein [Coriobacteriales bacterium]